MRRSVSDTNCNRNGNYRSKCYAYGNGNCDTYTNGYSNANTYAYTEGYANAATRADAKGSSDSAPSPVIGNADLSAVALVKASRPRD